MKNNEKRKKILEVKGLTKSFPGVLAVNHIDFELLEGEIHGIVGENGAGKSTFMKMINGSYKPDEGEIILNGESINLKSPQEATLKGIGMVHQELMLLPHLSVAENICVSWLIQNNKKIINWKELYEISKIQLNKLGVNYDPFDPVMNLSIAKQQIVSIARTLAANCNLLILDESTSAISHEDVNHLFNAINKLKKHNISIIFISHRLQEVIEISDRITVLRDGNKIGTYNTKDLSEEKMAELIVGRSLKEKFPKKINYIKNEDIVQVRKINIENKLFDIEFNVKKGEILGIVGALGAGKSEIALTLFGAYGSFYKGSIIYEGDEIFLNSPIDAIKNGIALVPEDRRRMGLILNQTVRFNISLPIIKKIVKKWFIKLKEEKEIAINFIEKLSIKCTSPEQFIENLSGGNQQKVVLAKWLAANAKLFIMDEPTRGIDVGAKIEIYKLINSLAEKGIGIILFSSEVPEACGIADRIIVLFKGKIVKEILRKDFDEYEIQRLVLSGR
ncbi:MAG: sugar ABC transporter ATP-binding protein [Candidatus Caldatribacteriota bacterium]